MTKPNYQKLLKMAERAEKHGVVMNDWIVMKSDPSCGTVGCLLGTDQYYDALDSLTEPGDYGYDTDRSLGHASKQACVDSCENLVCYDAEDCPYGLTRRAKDWLFIANHRTNYGRDFGGDNPFAKRFFADCAISKTLVDLDTMTTEVAVRRLRKFIYFKLKQEEIHEAWNNRIHTKHAQAENTEMCLKDFDDIEKETKEVVLNG